MGDHKELEERVFRAPPKEFTAARDALVAALKSDGRAAEAKEVKAWKRPVVPVWLWNRLALDGEESAEQAVSVAGKLAKAIAGDGAAKATHAIAELRAAGTQVVVRARQLAEQAGIGFSTAQERELNELVQALPWSEEARTLAKRGRLHEMPPRVDPFEAMRALASGAVPMMTQPPPEADDQRPAQLRRQLDAEAEAARTALAEAEAALAVAERALEIARASHARAQDAHAAAQRNVDEARERRDAAEAARQS
jgi:hypothetical protein